VGARSQGILPEHAVHRRHGRVAAGRSLHEV
jgi:hypothetical protein